MILEILTKKILIGSYFLFWDQESISSIEVSFGENIHCYRGIFLTSQYSSGTLRVIKYIEGHGKI